MRLGRVLREIRSTNYPNQMTQISASSSLKGRVVSAPNHAEMVKEVELLQLTEPRYKYVEAVTEEHGDTEARAGGRASPEDIGKLDHPVPKGNWE